MNNPSELPPELESAIRKYVASRCKLWSLLLGVPSLLVFLFGFAMLLEARRLRADVVRFGMPLEIYNPAWGTVIDGVDPAILPSRDPRDGGRRGALLQQYIPLTNDQQLWELRPRQTSAPPAKIPVIPGLDPLPDPLPK
jgi:hypothetical protein